DDEMGPYNSWGNGSAMRSSPVGWAFDTPDGVLEEARHTALPTHNHPQGIIGAQAVALAVFLARNGETKGAILRQITRLSGYNLQRTIAQIRPEYCFDVSCQGSVPEAIIAFLDSVDFEDAVRNAISLGGDADTQACIAGAIAEAYYGGVPQEFLSFVLPLMDDYQLEIATRFADRYLPEITAATVRMEAASRHSGEE
ncbi:MAG: hypothetical protein E4H09_03280, partial [Spirochaetales bacterium]